ncbi:flagellar basal-body rod modification protein FlgD [Clostridium algifaecis]|uniref:Basal-body rod modification protein FlgD n=1 Tax=Clostridium algifaecis TaxID=1472040 RepID=A0ABS4KMW9_9CLOT|nr:flagellar hook capping FlgD N-terminal domain-containing protein [Clostridium algifaecis]MBP2031384.1 flagellar basal-body rod modification protein FlgD [Clostridium algifaecis]
MTVLINSGNQNNDFYNEASRALAASTSSGTTDTSSSESSQKYYPIDTSDATTSSGTRVVKKNQDIDKNMFLKILSAELANQDPTSSDSQSSTQYISQLAQFSSLEQMANLNSSSKMGTANSLINKYVTFSDTDDTGNKISGEVVGVVKDGDDIKLNVLTGQGTDKDGKSVNEYQQINIDDAVKIDDLGDTFNTTANNNMLLNATSLIGKKVNIDEKDSSGNNYSGVVESVSREVGGVTVKVKLSDGTTKSFDFNDVSDVENS